MPVVRVGKITYSQGGGAVRTPDPVEWTVWHTTDDSTHAKDDFEKWMYCVGSSPNGKVGLKLKICHVTGC
jgi:hypothetical protein